MAEPSVGVRATFSSRSAGDNLPPSRVVIHATCPSVGYPRASAAGTALSTARYFASAAAGGSAHYIVDIAGEQHCVPDNTQAYHAPPNPRSIGIEICAEGGNYSLSYTRAQWLSPEVWPAVALAAARTREVCQRFGIPLVRVNATDLLAGQKGICGHTDVSQAFHQSTHSDPGPEFPWLEFMAAVTGGTAPSTAKDDSMSFIPVPCAADGTFKVTVPVEAGVSSAVVARAWISVGSAWGPTDFIISALNDKGSVMGPAAQVKTTVANNRRQVLEIPSGAVLATIEGKASPGAVPGASLVCLDK